MTSNSRFSINNNIGRSTDDTVFFDNFDAFNSTNDVFVFRDTLQGLKKEAFIDYLFLGYSNLDALGGITNNNDYSSRLKINGNLSLNGNLVINDLNYITYDSVNDITYQNSLLL